MSGIFGLIHLDGSPVPPEHLESMRQAMAHWGPDGTRVWRDGCAGLGQCLLFNTPEAVHERLPYATPDGRLAFTAEARIDNRDELFDALDIPHPDRATMPDGAVMLRAYEKWREEAPNHLFGDWSFAVWNSTDRRLFLARDHSGITSLYYFHDGHRFAFASDRRALLALSCVPQRLNELYLAQVLVGWPAYQGEDTIYLDVHRLGPAHAATVSPGRFRTWRFWRLEDVPDVRMARADDYADGLREHLMRSVRQSTRSLRTVAVSLSGGLDSGSVAALAARELASAGRDLVAFTSVPAYQAPDLGPGIVVDEFSMAAAAIRHARNVTHVPVAARDISPIGGVERMLNVHGEPLRNAGNYYWLAAIQEASRERDVGVLLTGQFGNHSISWDGVPALAHVREALAAGHRVEASAEVVSWLRARLPMRALRRWRKGLGIFPGGQPWRLYSPIHPAFAQRMRLRERMASERYDPTFSTPQRDGRRARFLALRPGRHIHGAIWAELGAAAGAEARDPTCDARLLAFVVGIPNHSWRGPMNRWLIRRAMAGLLPDEVRLGRARGRQGADIVRRILAHPAERDHLFRELSESVPAQSYVDVDYLRRADQQIRQRDDASAKLAADAILLRGGGAGLFIARRPRT